MEYKIKEEQTKRVLNRIQDYMNAAGIKKADIATGFGWQPSKLTKIFAGSQGVSFTDLLSITAAIGIPLDAFMEEEFDVKKYLKENAPMRLSVIFDMYEESYPAEDIVMEMISQELPYKLKSVLAFNTKLYAISWKTYESTDLSTRNIDSAKPHLSVYRPKVVIRPQVLRSRYDDFLEMGYWFAKNDAVMLGISFAPDTSKREPGHSKIRKDFYKSLLGDFSSTLFGRMQEIPKQYKFAPGLVNGEICSIIYDLNDIPSEEILIKDLEEMYKIYVKLLDEASDMKERFFWQNITDDGELPIPHAIGEKNIENKARKSAGYKCFINANHESFETENGNSYVECMHIVPLSQQRNFEANLDVIANIVCLCPNCMACMNYGKRADKEKMLVDMYYRKQSELEKNGINVSLAKLLKMHHVE